MIRSCTILYIYIYGIPIKRYTDLSIFYLLPDFGEDGGLRNIVEDPARQAEYKTDRTVVSIPRIRVPVETVLEPL